MDDLGTDLLAPYPLIHCAIEIRCYYNTLSIFWGDLMRIEDIFRVKRGQKPGSRRPRPRGLGQRARFATLSHVFAYCSSLVSEMRKSNGAARLGLLTRTRNAAMTSPLHVATHCAIRKRILKGKKQDWLSLSCMTLWCKGVQNQDKSQRHSSWPSH